MNITINTQSSIKFSTNKKIYFDPFKITSIENDADIIFITHEHYDHFSPEDIQKVINDKAIIIAPKSMQNNLSDFNNEKVLVEPGNKLKVFDFEGEVVPAYNELKPFHPKTNKWCGYVIELEGKKYYIAGDTDKLSENYNIECDVAFIPIGGTYTMDVDEAVEFTLNLKPSCVVPIHYGSIVGKNDDGEKFKKIIEKNDANIDVKLML